MYGPIKSPLVAVCGARRLGDSNDNEMPPGVQVLLGYVEYIPVTEYHDETMTAAAAAAARPG